MAFRVGRRIQVGSGLIGWLLSFLATCLPHCLIAEIAIQWLQVVATSSQLPMLRCDTLANSP